MPIVPLYGHLTLRERLLGAFAEGRLPASLLLQGPAGVGKQRLALWLGTALLCEAPARPCGLCQSCRYCSELAHPDLHWIFPRPRLKDTPTHEDVRDDYAEAVAERAAAGGLYARPSGSEGIFVPAVRSVVHRAVMSPALARRKVFVVGDAERMVPQEGADMAANAFLKLLEEPPSDTVIVLTSSEPGALLPTIRSRVVALRVVPLGESEMESFLADPLVAKRLDAEALSADTASRRMAIAAGAPGALFGGSERDAARRNARKILDVAESGDRAAALRVAFSQGASGARGRFSDTLDELSVLVHDRTRSMIVSGDERAAARSVRSIDAVERARELAGRNVSPNLITAELFRVLAERV